MGDKTGEDKNGPDLDRLTCPICDETIGNRESVILHMTCCSFVRAHKKCVDDFSFYKKHVVEKEPEYMAPRSI